MRTKASYAFKNYLRFNYVWKRLKEKESAVHYSFRHSHSKRAHQVYKSSDTKVAELRDIQFLFITLLILSGAHMEIENQIEDPSYSKF